MQRRGILLFVLTSLAVATVGTTAWFQFSPRLTGQAAGGAKFYGTITTARSGTFPWPPTTGSATSGGYVVFRICDEQQIMLYNSNPSFLVDLYLGDKNAGGTRIAQSLRIDTKGMSGRDSVRSFELLCWQYVSSGPPSAFDGDYFNFYAELPPAAVTALEAAENPVVHAYMAATYPTNPASLYSLINPEPGLAIGNVAYQKAVVAPVTQCNDGVDNDSDGTMDIGLTVARTFTGSLTLAAGERSVAGLGILQGQTLRTYDVSASGIDGCKGLTVGFEDGTGRLVRSSPQDDAPLIMRRTDYLVGTSCSIANLVITHPRDSDCANANDDSEQPTVSSVSSSSASSQPQATNAGDYAIYTCPVPKTALQISTGNFNGDSETDFVASMGGDNRLLLYLSNQQGGYSLQYLPVNIANPSGYWQLQTTVHDVTGDGLDDIVAMTVVAAGRNPIGPIILRGNGNGTFGSPSVQASTATVRSRVFVEDADGDGDLDLLFYGEDGQTSVDPENDNLYIMRGNGTGTFAPPEALFATGYRQTDVRGDFDGNGTLDLGYMTFLPDSTRKGIRVLLNNGGVFAAVDSLFDEHNGPYPNSMHAADFNGDGKSDLFVAENGTYGKIYLNDGTGRLTLKQRITNAGGATTAVYDFNRDGSLDVIVAGNLLLQPGDVRVFTGLPTIGTNVVNPTPETIPYNKAFSDLLAGDFDGDGETDLAFAHGLQNSGSQPFPPIDANHPAGISFLFSAGAPSACVMPPTPSSASSQSSAQSSSRWTRFKHFSTSSQITWFEARDACLAEGMQLATIATQQDYDDAFEVINGAMNVWIGLEDQATEGRYRWVSGVPFSKNFWYPYPLVQPNGTRTPEEDCVFINHDRTPPASAWWHDVACDGAQFTVRDYLCEIAEIVQCNDGKDNDGDGATDWPADFSCSDGQEDDDESSPLSQCQDGIDNDSDGQIDYPQDNGCRNLQDNTEEVDCNDNIDNDGDGLTDLTDPGCDSLTDDFEGDDVCKTASILIYNLQTAPFPQSSTPDAVADMRNQGYAVTYHTRISLPDFTTGNYLQRFDTVWFTGGCSDDRTTAVLLRSDDLAAIREYYEAGGNLILSPGNLTDGGGEGCTARINAIAEQLGVRFTDNGKNLSGTCTNLTSSASDLQSGVTKLKSGRISDMTQLPSAPWDPSGSATLVTFNNGNAAMAFRQRSSGRGGAFFLSHEDLLQANCNTGAMYANILGTMGMHKACDCTPAIAAESGGGLLSRIMRFLGLARGEYLTAQTTVSANTVDRSACGETQCNDGFDNDNDGLVDLSDPGCYDASDTTEQDSTTPLGNGACVLVEQNSAAGDGWLDIQCPSGYTAVGGGWTEYRNSDFGIEGSRPLADNDGWQCTKDSGLRDTYAQSCGAVCCRTDLIQTETVTATARLSEDPTAKCTAGFTITGGGFNDAMKGEDEELLRPEGEDAYHCLDSESTAPDSSCYAVCSKLASGLPLECVTVEIEKMNGAPVLVDCPSGTTITGGGFFDTSTGNDDEESSGPYDNGWTCWEDNSNSPLALGICYARCCYMPEPIGTTVSASLTGSWTSGKLRYSMILKNVGDEDAADAYITLQVPLLGVTADPLPSSCTNKGWNAQANKWIIECHHGTMTPNQQLPFDISFTVTDGNACTVAASAFADALNALPSNTVTASVALPCNSSSSSSQRSSSLSVSSTSSRQSSSSSVRSSAGTLSSTASLAQTSSASSTSNIVSSATSSSPSSYAISDSSSSESLQLSCGFDACNQGGSAFCSILGGSCDVTSASPCFSCNLIDAVAPDDACVLGGTAYCAAQGLACVRTDDAPYFRCEGDVLTNETVVFRDNTEFCTTNDECSSGFCHNYVCSACRAANDCGGDFVCLEGTCVDPSLLAQSAPEPEPSCGNGIREGAEQCDDGPQNSDSSGAHCRRNCTLGTCGDRIVDAPVEECDDGNQNDADACSNTCKRRTVVAVTQPVQGSALPAWTVLPAVTASGSLGQTGPASVAIMAAGAAGGLAWSRRRRKK